MVPVMANSLSAITQSISGQMTDLGFKARGQTEFLRGRKPLTQRLALSVREVPSENAAFVEAFVGFNFADVEEFAASLQGKRPRPGFMTCSLNIGSLTPDARIVEWPLPAENDAEPLAAVIRKMVSDFTVPFWEEFSTLEKLAAHYADGDTLLCRGGEWPWRCAAVHSLIGQPGWAIDFLQDRIKQVPSMSSDLVDAAISRLSQQKGK